MPDEMTELTPETLATWRVDALSDFCDASSEFAGTEDRRILALIDALEAERARVRTVLDAVHAAADELDEWEGDASPVLGGCSPGGVVRGNVHEAMGGSPFGEDRLACQDELRGALDGGDQ